MDQEKVIAVAHPGKLGDALYALPTLRYLCSRHNCKADFFTSSYCAPIFRLLEHQTCIRKVIVPEGYIPENGYCGIQPWQMPVPQEGYDAVYQLGLRDAPNKILPDFIAESVGAPAGLPIYYQYPETKVLGEPYIVIAPGKDRRFRATCIDLVKRCPVKCVIIGAPNEHIGIGIDATKLDPLDSIPWIAGSRGFVGMMSSPLVLANAFPIPKVVFDDGETWDMRHVMRGPLNFYPVLPTAQQIMVHLGFITYSKTLHPGDYNWIGEAQMIPQMLDRVNGAPIRFEHQHRCWEYGLILKALRDVGAKSILDVGGGGSAFAPSAAWLGMEVLQVDPAESGAWVAEQASRLKLNMTYVTKDFFEFESAEKFDAVTCLSVIEHVEKDNEFFRKLLKHVVEHGLLCLTTDFHPTGEKRTEGHLRTYAANDLLRLASVARANGFDYFGPRPYYLWHGAQVNDYTFASLVMQKVRAA